MKKISAKIIILLASILLVAHAVIPHLHYKNEIFIITPACNSDENHKHNAPEHNDDSENNQHNCILKQVVLIRSDNVKTVVANHDNPNIRNFNITFPFILFSSNIFNFKIEKQISPPPVFNTSLYSRLVDCNINSRGSPTV